MALVDYDYGSDSEEEEAPKLIENSIGKNEEISLTVNQQSSEIFDETEEEVESLKNGDASLSKNYSSEISDEEEEYAVSSEKSCLSQMFEKLPPKKEEESKVIPEVFDDKVEDFIPKAQIPKKEKTKVRINIPSLSSFDHLTDEEPSLKKLKPSVKGTGLLSILPPVKCVPISNKSFVPNVLKMKSKSPLEKPTNQTTQLIPHSVRKKQSELKKSDKHDESDDSDIELPETFNDELWQKTCGKVVKKDIVEEIQLPEVPIINAAPEAVEPYQGLNNEAFKELVGKSSRIPQNIKLIDINEDELVAEKDLWMTKSLTDPEYVPKKSIEDPVDPTKRRKHHITYLAQQAKANEQELQSQWSSSKFKRNQTRAKYGF